MHARVPNFGGDAWAVAENKKKGKRGGKREKKEEYPWYSAPLIKTHKQQEANPFKLSLTQ